MSLVGPRPLMRREERQVGGPAQIRALFRPGITGALQVRGRNDLSFEEMMMLDCDYVVNRSLVGDLHLLIQTVPVVRRPPRAC
jgi:lipopolysaccharide/colanic/teichoic acid biosynthesis glycosyltransferase